MELEELQRRVAMEGEQGGRGYSPGLRAQVIAYVRRRCAAGETETGWRVAGALGISWTTLRRWMGESPAFVPVEISPAVRPTGVVIHGPRGLRIEGADAQFVAELILALS